MSREELRQDLARLGFAPLPFVPKMRATDRKRVAKVKATDHIGVAKGLLKLQRSGKLTVRIDAGRIRVEIPKPLTLTWEQAAELVNKKARP